MFGQLPSRKLRYSSKLPLRSSSLVNFPHLVPILSERMADNPSSAIDRGVGATERSLQHLRNCFRNWSSRHCTPSSSSMPPAEGVQRSTRSANCPSPSLSTDDTYLSQSRFRYLDSPLSISCSIKRQQSTRHSLCTNKHLSFIFLSYRIRCCRIPSASIPSVLFATEPQHPRTCRLSVFLSTSPSSSSSSSSAIVRTVSASAGTRLHSNSFRYPSSRRTASSTS